MSRNHEYFTDLYTDTLGAFVASTHLPAYVVRTGDGYVIRTDFELGRFLVAANTGSGLSPVRSELERWSIGVYQRSATAPELLATATGRDLVSAYTRAVEQLELAGAWSPVEVALDRPIAPVEGAA
ncbi:hypothetical protein EGT67_06405 [Prescottella agglutinans]|uniref:Uncharacterized protein n=1 Tax=Prescottella agglutinans TaxID=1644129 RepID=A0A438BI63_9NOCA|nr:hypothetical protein [Prescottella agglutinans]RVW10769.1 hypothetical protein EGT67_06405 [Prescottella agglutinans]